MRRVLLVYVEVLLLAGTTGAQQRLTPPSTVHIVTEGQTVALYHRESCSWVRQGASTAFTIEDAKKRHYLPHCLCISGNDGPPPCELAALGAASQTTTSTTLAAPTSNATETVYATRTGEKYHRTGCRSLSRSQIPMMLKEASDRYGPCSVCRPPILNTAAAAVSTATPVERATTTPPSRPVTSGLCQATTKRGTQCSRNAQTGRLYCWQH